VGEGTDARKEEGTFLNESQFGLQPQPKESKSHSVRILHRVNFSLDVVKIFAHIVCFDPPKMNFLSITTKRAHQHLIANMTREGKWSHRI